MTEMILLLLATAASLALGYFVTNRLMEAIREHRREVSRKRAAPYGTAKRAHRPKKSKKRTNRRP